MEYNSYKNFTRFDSNTINATVLKYYTKEKNNSRYQVLKLKTDQHFTLYITTKKEYEDIVGRDISLEIYTKKLTFYNYLTSYFSYYKHFKIKEQQSYKKEFEDYLQRVHSNKDVASFYMAIYSARALGKEIQTQLSNLGISHLVAISGFHLGVLTALLYFLIKFPVKFFQKRYFPHRDAKIDSFFIVAILLLGYLLFLDSPASLLRSFAMFFIAFVLYDRGVEILSMQTLYLTILLLLALFPRLLFEVGFWLSVSGVFYIFLYLIHFKDLNKYFSIFAISLWVYVMMLPYSLALFGNFSLFHPLSVVLSIAFTLFYPLSILLHFFGFGDIFDSYLSILFTLQMQPMSLEFSKPLVGVYMVLSLFSVRSKYILYVIISFTTAILFYALSHLV